MRIWLFCWLLLFSVAATATATATADGCYECLSQLPAPSRPEEDSQPQTHATQASKEPQAPQRGGDQSPFVVKVAPSLEAYPDRDDQQAERKTKAAEDWWTLAFTGVTALATIILSIITGVLCYATWKLWQVTATAVEDSKASSVAAIKAANAAADHVGETAKMAKAMNRSADAMEGVAKESAEQRALMGGQLEAGRRAAEAADLSAKAAIGVEVPFLRVDRLIVKALGQTSYGLAGAPAQFIVELYIQNYGRTPAFVDDLVVNASVGVGETPRYIPAPNILGFFVIPEKGSHKYEEFRYLQESSVGTEDWPLIRSGEKSLYIYGIVKFRDFLNNKRLRGFIFIYLPNLDVLVPAYWMNAYDFQE